MNQPPTAPASKRRRRGCCGCLVALVVLGIGAVALVVAGPFILRAIGLFGPTAEQLYSGAPDRAAAAAIESALADRAVDGVDVVVLPITGQTGQVAVLTIPQDASAGGIQGQAEAETFIKETMATLVATNRANDLGVEQVAVNLAGPAGETLVTIAASAEVTEAYASGQISRAQFLESVGVDYSNLLALLRAEGLWEGQ
jgi:hypothetical protein